MIHNNFSFTNSSEAASMIAAEINKRHTDKTTNFLVAIDGRSGTGKSTLAQLVAEKVNGVIVIGDDFYSGGNDDRWQECTPQVKADMVIDWKKMRVEVLEPLKSGKTASWHPLDFVPGKGWVGWKDEIVRLEPSNVIILEGAYSARPELRGIVDLTVLVESTDDVRKRQLRDREGEKFMKKWHEIWDEAEDYYFSKVSPNETFDLVIQLF